MTKPLRRTVKQAAVFWIAACAILAASTVSCSRGQIAQTVQEAPSAAGKEPDFTVPEAGSLVLVLGRDGRLEQFPAADGQTRGQGPDPVPFAVQTAIAAVLAPVDGGAMLAVNRSGLMHLEIQNRQVFLRRIEGPAAEFTGRSVAQAWLWNGKAMFLLHRNEIFEPGAARDPAARIIAATRDGYSALPAFIPAAGAADQQDSDLYKAPYALFPRTPRTWLVQFRLGGQEKTRTAFATWNPDENLITPMERSRYETAVRPAPLADAPAALRHAAGVLGGTLIIDASMPDGSHQSWVQGSGDTILAVRAVVSDSMVMSLASDGRIVMVAADNVRKAAIHPPVALAYFRDLALLGDFIIAVWEENLFPDIGRSGLVIMDSSLLRAESR